MHNQPWLRDSYFSYVNHYCNVLILFCSCVTSRKLHIFDKEGTFEDSIDLRPTPPSQKGVRHIGALAIFSDTDEIFVTDRYIPYDVYILNICVTANVLLLAT